MPDFAHVAVTFDHDIADGSQRFEDAGGTPFSTEEASRNGSSGTLATDRLDRTEPAPNEVPDPQRVRYVGWVRLWPGEVTMEEDKRTLQMLEATTGRVNWTTGKRAGQLYDLYQEVCGEDAFPIDEAIRIGMPIRRGLLQTHLVGERAWEVYLSQDNAATCSPISRFSARANPGIDSASVPALEKVKLAHHEWLWSLREEVGHQLLKFIFRGVHPRIGRCPWTRPWHRPSLHRLRVPTSFGSLGVVIADENLRPGLYR